MSSQPGRSLSAHITVSLCAWLLCSLPLRAWAQDEDRSPAGPPVPETPGTEAAAPEEAAPEAAAGEEATDGDASSVPAEGGPEASTQDKLKVAETPPVGSTLGQSVTRYSVLIGIPVTALVYGQQIWGWGDTGGWTWGNEGWFGTDSPHGGVDKVGHAFSHYVLYRASESIFEYTENGGPRKRVYAFLLASAVGVGIEVGDAYNGSFGFSWQDIVADFAGIGLGVVMEEIPAVEALVGFSAEYFPTRGWIDRGEPLDFGEDYSGYKYMLNFKLAGTEHLGFELPRVLDFVTLDVGYYARGFEKYDPPDAPNVRTWFVGASLNVPELVDLAFGRSGSLLNRSLHEVFGYYHLPLGYKLTSDID